MTEGQDYLLGALETDVRHLKTGQERLERQMESGFADIKETFREPLKNHADRIGVLEGWKSWVTGGLAGLGLLYAAMVAWLFNWLGPR